MARNDDGEFELIVGNRQLLTIVFIIFVLCGIVFTMGYFVGRNSGPPLPAAAKEPASPAASKPEPTDTEASSAQLQPGETRVATPQTPQQTAPEQTQPAAQPPAEEPKPVEKAAPAPTAPVQAARKEAAKPASAGPAAAVQPAPGTYLQVSAVTRGVGDNVVGALKSKGFPAFLAPSSKDGLFRVLVGPVSGSAAYSKMKADLDAVGFRDVRMQKY